jgi:molybdopterin-guanine dinucleotide biosynthesis protein A
MYSAAILAGGDARRFGGRDKSALVVDGRTILDRQIEELSSLTSDLLVIRRADDLVPGCGPLGGLHTALSRARGDRVFLLACDMPYVTAAFAGYLLSLSDDVDVDVDVVVPRTERGRHPLCAVYRRRCLVVVAKRLAERRLKMVELLDDLRVHEVKAEDIDRFGDRHRLLANVNTPAEYTDLEALHGHGR